jgi:hypothetical protein
MRFFKRWDVAMVLALMFTATVTPFEVAFLSTDFNTMFLVNRFVDLIFLIVRAHQRAHSPTCARRVPCLALPAATFGGSLAPGAPSHGPPVSV